MPKVYMLVWVSWNSGKMSDFALPKTLGYFRSYDAADLARLIHQTRLNTNPDNIASQSWVDHNDYRIDTFDVEG